MERKNYLVGKLSAKENSYIKRIVVNRVNRYLRDNYYDLKNNNISLYDNSIYEIDDELLLDKMEDKICTESAKEIEDVIIKNERLYNIVKALPKNERAVLFLMFNEQKNINDIAKIMNLSRWTVRRIKDSAFNHIINKLLGRNENV